MGLAAVGVSGAKPASEVVVNNAPSPLLAVRRIHVEKLTGGETAHHVRDMVIASLQRSGLFLLTENPDKADAVLRGSAEDLVFTDTFQSSESLNARVSAGWPDRNGTTRSTSSRNGMSAGVGESESTRIAERKHEATAAVRLVNREGDVIWSTTQESLGAKFRGASADVAEKISRQLVEDVKKARR
ncbi:MAG: hypothetical protein IT162_09145 [Bryobacterales bacterium]|nr:hypothetical protein [Bryobacterales bacterium]